jgi:hypothetical protein
MRMATAGQQTRTAAEHGSQAVLETTAAMTEIRMVVGQAASKVRELGVLGRRSEPSWRRLTISSRSARVAKPGR